MTERRPVLAIVTDAIWPYHRGGKEMRYEELFSRLATRAEVHVYTMNWWEGAPQQVEDEVTFHAICPRVPLYSGQRRSFRQAALFGLCCLRLLFKRFDSIEADQMPFVPLLPLKLVSIIRRKRLVATWHEVWGPEYWNEYLGRAGRIGWLCESIAMRLPDAIMADTPETAERLSQYVADSTEVRVVPIGVDVEAIRNVPAEPEGTDVIVVGRLLPHKRVDLLLDAIAQLRARGIPLRATVVGRGPQLQALRRRADSAGLNGSVTFLGGVDDHDELYAKIKGARVAAFPSEREGFGIAVLEALACGVPVVTTSAPDNLSQHLVERAPTGIVCEPDVQSLAHAITQALELARDGLQDDTWLEKYDWDNIADEVAEVLLP